MNGILRLAALGLRRNLRHNVLAALGIVIGIAAFTFFMALDGGVRRAVARIFPADRLDVVPRRSSLLGTARPLDDAAVRALANPPTPLGVRPREVFPRLTLSFPARGWGGRSLIGQDLYFEVSGFCDGVGAAAAAADVRAPYRFADGATPARVAKAQSCGAGHQPCKAGTFCAEDIGRCLGPVPTLISPHMIELYNSTLAHSHRHLPRIPAFADSIFLGRVFTVELGRSYMGAGAARGGAPIRRRFQLVGVSDKARPIGLTVPLPYVKRWNLRYAGPTAAGSYASVVMVVQRPSHLTPLAAHVRELGFDVAENRGEQIGVFITIVSMLFALISFVIVGVSAINIAHTFLMLVSERRHEFGVLRAVGATPADVHLVVLLESAVLGVASGLVGTSLAWAAAWAVDAYSAHYVPAFPFKPDSFFFFTPGLALLSFTFAVLFCVLGALLPAHRAARMDPVSALAGR